jgi:sulfotransferase family protein
MSERTEAGIAARMQTQTRAVRKQSALTFGRLTAGARPLPDFLIIGAQRSGTTSLARYLAELPAVRTMASIKGAHYFDKNYHRGLDWYRGHFPSSAYRAWVKRRTGFDLVTGEGSPYYLLHPHVPARVAAVMPSVKIIAMLRDPIERAYSGYQHEYGRGFETLGFEEAIEAEPRRLAGERERMLADPAYHSFSFQHHSYLTRGLYLDQLLQWRERFPREQMLILGAEEFFAEPARVFGEVLDFLQLPKWSLPRYEQHNARSYAPMSPEMRARLEDFFREPNRRLFDYLGRSFAWSS